MSIDPSDLVPFTPTHFLICRALCNIADPDLKDISETKLPRWQVIQKIQQHFCERWNKEYISELQQRNKWTKQAGSLKENQLVIIKDDNLSSFKIETRKSNWTTSRNGKYY